jgi:acyl dehydratase
MLLTDTQGISLGPTTQTEFNNPKRIEQMINYEAALNQPPVVSVQTYSERDTILYALGVGFGDNPIDPNELGFVYELGLTAMPTMGVILASASLRALGLDINYAHMVHGDQNLVLHRPLPTSGCVRGETRVIDIIDKGQDKGALIRLERAITDDATGEAIATSSMTAFCRKDGGFGGPARPTPPVHPIPDRTADMVCEIATELRAALIYRLSGDYNPLHIDPAMAAKAGFARPILHGLATFGLVGRAILKSVLDYQADRLTEIGGRFSSPVFPGDTIGVEIWRDDNILSMRARAMERDVVVLTNGRAVIS